MPSSEEGSELSEPREANLELRAGLAAEVAGLGPREELHLLVDSQIVEEYRPNSLGPEELRVEVRRVLMKAAPMRHFGVATQPG